MEQKRILYLDALRGWAILLVIVGHLIQYNYTSSIHNGMFNVIYSFHMPLFFFLSGCTRYLQEESKGPILTWTEICRFGLKKFRSLLVPSIAWTLLIPLFFSSTWKWEGRVSDFWFLNVLFIISCLWSLMLFCGNKIGNRKLVLSLCSIVFVVLFALGIKRIPIMYLSLYMFGYLFQRNSFLERIPDVMYSISTLLFLLLAGYFNYGLTAFGDESRVWLELPLSVLASLSLVKLFSLIKNKYIVSLTVMLGQYSMGVYLSHFLFVNIPSLEDLEIFFSDAAQFIIEFIQNKDQGY